MKRILVFVVSMIVCIANVNAQEDNMPKNEVAVSVGFGTHAFISVAFSDAFAEMIEGEGSSDRLTGAYGLTYLRNVSSRTAFGISGTYEQMYRKSNSGYKTTEEFITVMPTVRLYWFRGKAFGMYSRLAAGASFHTYDYKDEGMTDTKSKSNIYFAFHAAPISLEIGSRAFSGFLELGYGYNGIVNAGLKFGF